MGFGRPTKYDPDFHPDNFIQLAKKGKLLIQIALIWDVHVDTLYEWAKVHKDFSDAVKAGRQLAEAWYVEIGQAAITGARTVGGQQIKFNVGAFVWLTKNLFKWDADKPEQKVITIEDQSFKATWGKPVIDVDPKS